jgi:hypothetical protein
LYSFAAIRTLVAFWEPVVAVGFPAQDVKPSRQQIEWDCASLLAPQLIARWKTGLVRP